MKSQNRCSNPNGVHFCHHPTHPTLGRWYILQNVPKKVTLQLLFIRSGIQRQILAEEFPDIGSRFL
ncbi:unnamed protein product [Musa acuminata subsp. malaccensis]|uniref:(wild Malaysian banana) hypothetical protein n=1 Tax=Musa acuminata subsp. malaccensis TaxID=214687 RepID=A0A804L327_MUSAM|nr:unnamed protein product [Musa acuminata subsp. malaccensis]